MPLDAPLVLAGVARPVDVTVLLKPAAVRDSGIKSGGAATELPMLDHPPSTGVTPALPARGVVVGVEPAAVPDHAGADVPPPDVVFVHGDETPLPELVVAGAVVDPANGFDDVEDVILLNPCSAARMPASTPSRTAELVSVSALCVRRVMEGALGAGGWP
jgi:hypothetical protein